MVRGMNKVQLIGTVELDPELRHTWSGLPLATFTVVVTSKERVAPATQAIERFRVVAWGTLANTCHEQLHRHSQLYLEGRLQTRMYTDRAGVQRTAIEIVAGHVLPLDDVEQPHKPQPQDMVQPASTFNFAPLPTDLTTQGRSDRHRGASVSHAATKDTQQALVPRQIQRLQLTAEALQRLRDEYDYLTTEGRRRMAEEMRGARERGELQEGAARLAEREQYSRLEARITQLTYILGHAELIESPTPGQVPQVVTLGCTVTVRLDGEEETYTVVSPLEASPREGKISHESPVGSAVLGHSVGESVGIIMPNGRKTRARITAITQ